MKTIITILFSLFSFSLLSACSCSSITFCSAMKADEGIIFLGETIKTKEFDDGYHSAVIRVIKKIKGEDVLTDTIELFGGQNGAGCEANLNLRKGDTYYFALINASPSTIDINQFEMNNENNWSLLTHLCFYKKLSIQGDFVKGCISKEFNRYPLEFFEQDLVDCSFSVDRLKTVLCPNFKIGPNPVRNTLFLTDPSQRQLIDALNIYSTSGSLLLSADSNEILNGSIEIPNFGQSLIILEITCGEENFFQKIVISY